MNRFDVLMKQTDAQAARILGITRQAAQQLRQRLKVPVTTQEAKKQQSELQDKRCYLRCVINPNLVTKSNEATRARRYAKANNLQWPPNAYRLAAKVKLPPNLTLGREIYDFKVANPDTNWVQMNKHFKMKCAFRMAQYYASKTNKVWPLGEDQ